MERSIHNLIPLTSLSTEYQQQYINLIVLLWTFAFCCKYIHSLWSKNFYWQIIISVIIGCLAISIPCCFLYSHYSAWSDEGVQRLLNDGDVPNFINIAQRHGMLKDIRSKLRLLAYDPQPTRVLVLHGMGGSGKTMLAAEAIHYPMLLKDCFYNGIVWKSVGHMRGMYGETLRSEIYKLLMFFLQHPMINPKDQENIGLSDLSVDISSLKQRLRPLLRERKMLLVLDDVWHSDVIDAFANLHIVLLVTARIRTVAEHMETVSSIRYVEVTKCNENEAKDIVTSLCGQVDDEIMNALLKRCDGLPLALAIMASVLKGKPPSKQMEIASTPSKAEWFREKFPAVLRRYASLADALVLSISELEGAVEERLWGKTIMPSGPEIAHLYFDIAALDEDEELFASKLVPVWKHEDTRFTGRLLETFADRNLLIRTRKKHGDEDVFTIPNVQLDFLRELVIWREGSLDDRRKRWIAGFLLRNNRSDLLVSWELSNEPFRNEKLWYIVRAFEREPLASEKMLSWDEWWQRCMEHIAHLLGQRNKLTRFQSDLFGMLLLRVSPSKMGWTIIHQAALEGLSNIIPLLLQDVPHLTIHMATNGTTHTNNDYKFTSGTAPLHAAAASGKTNVVTLLIENGADVNQKDNSHCTPLLKASEIGHAETVNVLIKAGANVSETSADGITPLHRASYFGHGETAEVLIKAGANVNIKRDDEQTPLHEASCMGRTELVRMLLSHKADKNIMDNINKTPRDIICACSGADKSQSDAIRRLLDE